MSSLLLRTRLLSLISLSTSCCPLLTISSRTEVICSEGTIVVNRDNMWLQHSRTNVYAPCTWPGACDDIFIPILIQTWERSRLICLSSLECRTELSRLPSRMGKPGPSGHATLHCDIVLYGSRPMRPVNCTESASSCIIEITVSTDHLIHRAKIRTTVFRSAAKINVDEQ